MRTWLDGLLAWTGSIQTERDLLDGVQRYANELNFEWFSLGLCTALPLSSPALHMRSNFSASWQRRYEQAGYLHVDPSVQHGRRHNLPFIWSGQIMQRAPDFWEEARAEGLRHGWACARTHASRHQSMLTLARSDTALGAAELDANETKMRWLGDAIAPSLERLLVAPAYQAQCYQLTSREIEVLRWTADGKTQEEIGRILAISFDTVKFHIKNAVAKLGTPNKTAAVVRAAVLGIIN